MPLSMHQAAIPAFTRALGALSAILKKGEAFAQAKGMDPKALLDARLAPDMHPLTRQVQIASDSVKGGAARLAGVEPPSFPDTETSFAELQARIDKTLAYIKGITPEQMDGSEDRTITLPVGGGSELKLPGAMFLFGFALPNLYFHVTTAYAILRHSGVELGKRDYIGGL